MDSVIEFNLECGFKNLFHKISALLFNFSAEASSVIMADVVEVTEFHCLVLCHPDGINFLN